MIKQLAKFDRVSLLGVALLVIASPAFVGKAISVGSVVPERKDDEEKRLLAIIRDKEAQESARERCVQAIERLGEIRSVTAVDDLIELITFKRTLRSEENPSPIVIDREHPVTPLSLYPAAGALFYIGKPARPALLRLIETSDPDSLASQNAVYTLMAIFREDPKAGIRYLQNAGNKAQTLEASKNLLRAVERARNLFRIE